MMTCARVIKASQFSKADAPMRSDTETLSSDLQWKKASSSMTLTVAGMTMLFKLSHPSKVFTEILAKDRGSVICSKALQPAKAP